MRAQYCNLKIGGIIGDIIGVVILLLLYRFKPRLGYYNRKEPIMVIMFPA